MWELQIILRSSHLIRVRQRVIAVWRIQMRGSKLKIEGEKIMLWQKIAGFVKWGTPLWLFLWGAFAIIFAAWGFYSVGFSGAAAQIMVCGMILILFGVVIIRRRKLSLFHRGEKK